ncbi:WxL domain-containing protein [Enterococcus sp. DIV0840c]|uniref:WxL domain-containing protein n=1 Tax=Enterococcus sp. DIV0840c TaxID=2774772 RepID=UPI003D2B488A
MKNRKKITIFIITSLFIQTLVFPIIVHGTSLTETVNTEENSENQDFQIPESDIFNNNLDEKQSNDPNFTLHLGQQLIPMMEVFPLAITVDQKVEEFHIEIPLGISLVESELATDIFVEKLTSSKWLIKSPEGQAAFVLPIRAEKDGIFEIAIDDETITFQVDEHTSTSVDDSINNEEKKHPESIEESSRDNDSFTESVAPYVENGIQDVANWEEFIQAFVNPDVSKINIVNDFETPDNPRLNLMGVTAGATSNVSGTERFVYLNVANISRTLVVEGNGHQIDFRSITLCFYPTTAQQNNPWNITLRNLEIYHGNWYGPLTYNDLGSTHQPLSTLTYENITNVGSQLIHSPTAKVRLAGKVSSNQVTTYTSKFRTWNVMGSGQTNIQVSKLTVLENADIELSTVSDGNIDLGRSSPTNSPGEFIMESGSSLTATANGSGGEADGLNLLVVSGNVMISDSATLKLTPQDGRSAISLRSTNASLDIGKDSTVSILSSRRTSSGNSNITNLVWMAAGSALNISDGGTLNIDATGQGSSTSNIVHVNGAAKVSVGKDATLDIKSDSTAQAQSLLYFANANSTFTFSDAKRVNLQRTGILSGTSTTNGLINIAGSNGLLDIDVQSVEQWARGNFNDIPTYSWKPIFNLSLRYTGVVSRIDSVDSISQGVADSFNDNFSTQNVQRILFEKISDVDVTIDPLTSNRSEINSYTITGRATPNSVIQFTGDPAIPQGNIDSPVVSENEKYHTLSDENGDYSYRLPVGYYFTAGNEVIAYAFLNGKYDSARTIVEERVGNPFPVDPLDPEIEVDPENKPELPEDQGLLSIDFASSFNFGTQSISLQEQTYYAQPQRLLNEDGTVNEEEARPNYIQISDRRSENERNGWELAVTQKEQFKGEENQELVGARLSLLNQQLVTVQGGTAPGLQTVPSSLVPGNRRTLLKAQGNEGTGTWIYRFGDGDSAGESVALNVPKGANPEATTYSTTLIWELSAVPDN